MVRKKSWNCIWAFILVFSLLLGTFSDVDIGILQRASAKTVIPVSTITVGKKITISFIFNGKKVKNSKVKWGSKNKKIAKISKKGVVTGVKKGTTKIYAKYKGVKYWRKIVVKKKSTAAKTTPQPATPTPKPWEQTIPGLTKVSGKKLEGTLRSNPPRNIRFTVEEGKQLKLQAISTFHYNAGKGVAPGTIGITKDGVTVGTWNATGRNGNIWWDAYTDITLYAGKYIIIDSDRETWSCGDSNSGINQVYGIISDAPAVIPTASSAASPAPSVTTTASPSASFDPQAYIESPEEHENQGNIPDTPKPVSTVIPGETGVDSSIRISTQEINSAPKAAASVTQSNPQAKAGNVSVDFGNFNLKEDTTLTVRTLPSKTDSVNGYTASLWSLDTGSQKEFILPVKVTVPYDASVKDPEAELDAQCWNEDAGSWENVSFDINTSDHTITMVLYRATVFGIFRDENAAEDMDDSGLKKLISYKNAGKDAWLSVDAATKLKPTKASYAKYAKLLNTSLSEQKFNDILNSRLTDPLEYTNVLDGTGLATNISNWGNGVISFGNLICQEYGTLKNAANLKEFLTGSGAMLCGIGLGITALDYAEQTMNGKKTDKEYLLNAWPELLLTAASIPESLGAVAGFINGTGAAASAAAAAGTTTLAPWLTAIAAVAVLAKYQMTSQKEPAKVEYAELLSLMRVMTEETYFNPKTGRLYTYLPETAVNRLKALGTDDYEKKGLTKSAVSAVLSHYRPDAYQSSYVRLGNSRYPNYSGWAEIMDYITKKYKKNPEKWIGELENYASVAADFGSPDPSEVNVLAYAFLGESALGLGDQFFGPQGKASYQDIKKCSDYIRYEVMDGLQNNKFFKNFAENFNEKVEQINRRNWKKQIKELSRELTFTLMNQRGVKVSFNELAEYKDKCICFETAPAAFTLKSPWRVNMDSSTIASSTYFGYTEMGCRVQQLGNTNTADATQYLLVYNNAADCLAGDEPISRIPFIGPKEYGQKEIIIRVDGTQTQQVKPTATPAPTDPNANGDVELSETTVIFQSLTGSKTLTLKGAGDGNITWSAGTGKVVKLAVSADQKSCVLTPLAYGSDTIYVSYAGKTYKCMVYVEKEVQFDKTSISLKVGETATLSVINAENATAKNLDTVWSSGNSSIASLSDKTMKTAVVKGEGKGSTTITKRYTYNDGSVKVLECKVTVEDVLIAGIVPNSLTLKVGETKTLTLQGVDLTRQNTWYTMDIADVKGNGLTATVTGKKAGTDILNVVSMGKGGIDDLKFYFCNITVVGSAAPTPTPTPAPTSQPGKDNYSGSYYGVHTYTAKSGEVWTTKYQVIVSRASDGTYTWEVGDDSLVPGDFADSYFIYASGKASVSNGVLKGTATDMAGTYRISVSGGVCNYSFESAMGDDANVNITLYRK